MWDRTVDHLILHCCVLFLCNSLNTVTVLFKWGMLYLVCRLECNSAFSTNFTTLFHTSDKICHPLFNGSLVFANLSMSFFIERITTENIFTHTYYLVENTVHHKVKCTWKGYLFKHSRTNSLQKFRTQIT
jgi:hypothetical protein